MLSGTVFMGHFPRPNKEASEVLQALCVPKHLFIWWEWKENWGMESIVPLRFLATKNFQDLLSCFL